MKLNNIEIPAADNRGRAFPYLENGPQFAGPVIVNGQLMVIKAWENRSRDDRKYLRFVFETVEESGLTLSE